MHDEILKNRKKDLQKKLKKKKTRVLSLSTNITRTTTMAGNKTQKPHAIFISYPLQGHVNPSVQLALKLASQGFTITFVNTHFIHQQMTKASPEMGSDIFAGVRKSGLDIRYMTLSDGLPLGFDRSLNHEQFMSSLLHVFSAHAEEVIGQIVRSGENVHCLIADTYFVWPSKLAKKFGLYYISFWTESALVFTLYYHLDLLTINGHFQCYGKGHECFIKNCFFFFFFPSFPSKCDTNC